MNTLVAVGICAVVLGALLLLFRHCLEAWNTRTQNQSFTPKDDPHPPAAEGYTYKYIVGIAAGICVTGAGLLVAGLVS